MTPGVFDSHAHFTAETAPAILARAKAAQMAGVMAVGADEKTNQGALAAALATKGALNDASFQCQLACGFDYSARISPEEAVQALEKIRLESTCPLSAIGEVGLDATYTEVPMEDQCALFENEVTLAASWGLPLIVHCRDTESDILSILRRSASPTLRAEGRLGVLHCFVGNEAFARDVLDLGMMISFSGIVTFRNADALRSVAKTIPLDRLLVETDSPYLAPVPLRGKTNEPAFVEHTIRLLATLRGESLETLVQATTANAKRLFTN